MSWASKPKEQLSRGLSVVVYPRGNSMVPLIKSGEKVTIKPIKDYGSLRKGDIVLVTVKGNDYLHLIKARDAGRFLIGNNHGRINGWVSSGAIHGVKSD